MSLCKRFSAIVNTERGPAMVSMYIATVLVGSPGRYYVQELQS